MATGPFLQQFPTAKVGQLLGLLEVGQRLMRDLPINTMMPGYPQDLVPQIEEAARELARLRSGLLSPGVVEDVIARAEEHTDAPSQLGVLCDLETIILQRWREVVGGLLERAGKKERPALAGQLSTLSRCMTDDQFRGGAVGPLVLRQPPKSVVAAPQDAVTQQRLQGWRLFPNDSQTPLSGALAQLFDQGEFDVFVLGGSLSLVPESGIREGIHVAALEMWEVVHADRCGPLDAALFATVAGVTPTPATTIRIDFWRFLEPLLVGRNANGGPLPEAQRLAREGQIRNKYTETRLRDLAHRLAQDIEGVDPRQGIEGLVRVVEEARKQGQKGRHLPLACYEAWHAALRALATAVAQDPFLSMDAKAALLDDIPPQFGLRRKAAKILGVDPEQQLPLTPPPLPPDATVNGLRQDVRRLEAERDAARRERDARPTQTQMTSAVAAAKAGLFTKDQVDAKVAAEVAAAKRGLFTRVQVDAEVVAAKTGLFTQAQMDAAVAAAKTGLFTRKQLDDAVVAAKTGLFTKDQVDAKVAAAKRGLFTQAQVDAEVAAAKAGLFTKDQVDAAVAAAKRGLFTQAQVDAKVDAAKAGLFTKAQMDASVAAAKRGLFTQAQVDAKVAEAKTAGARSRDDEVEGLVIERDRALEAARREAAAKALLQEALDATAVASTPPRVESRPPTPPPPRPAARAVAETPPPPPARPSEPVVASGEYSALFCVSNIVLRSGAKSKPGEALAHMGRVMGPDSGRESFNYGGKIVFGGGGQIDLRPGAVAEMDKQHHFVTLYDPKRNEYSFPSTEDVCYGNELRNADRAATSGTGKNWRTPGRFNTFFIPEKMAIHVSGADIQFQVEFRGGVRVQRVREGKTTNVAGAVDTVTAINLQEGDALIINHAGTERPYWVKKTAQGAIIIDGRAPGVLI